MSILIKWQVYMNKTRLFALLISMYFLFLFSCSGFDHKSFSHQLNNVTAMLDEIILSFNLLKVNKYPDKLEKHLKKLYEAIEKMRKFIKSSSDAENKKHIKLIVKISEYLDKLYEFYNKMLDLKEFFVRLSEDQNRETLFVVNKKLKDYKTLISKFAKYHNDFVTSYDNMR